MLGYCLIVFAVGPTLLTWIYGPEFSSAGNLTRIAAVHVRGRRGELRCGHRHPGRSPGPHDVDVAPLAHRLVRRVDRAPVVWFGVVGAAWAGVFTAAAGVAATLAVFRSYVTGARRRAGMAPKPGDPPSRVGPAPREAPTIPPGPGMGVILGLSATEGHDAAVERD